MAGDPLVEVPESVWRPTVKRARILAQVAAREHCSKEQIDEAAKKLKISRVMLYRLLARFRESEQATSLLPSKPGRKPGSKELAVEQEKIVEKLIRGFYLSRQKPTVTALHRTIGLECFQADLPAPSYKAVPRVRDEAVNSPDLDVTNKRCFRLFRLGVSAVGVERIEISLKSFSVLQSLNSTSPSQSPTQHERLLSVHEKPMVARVPDCCTISGATRNQMPCGSSLRCRRKS